MQRFQRGLIRIVKGPTGGFLASLGIAAILGGVALASPAPPIAAVGSHPAVVVAAAPLGGDAPSASAASAVASGGVRTEDDPSGRGLAVDPVAGGNRPGDSGAAGPASHGEGPGRGEGGSPAGNGSSGGTRSGVSPAQGDARNDPSMSQGHQGHHGGGSGSDGKQGNDPSGHDQKPTPGPGTKPNEHDDGGGNGAKGSGGDGSGDKGSGDKGSGDSSGGKHAGKTSDEGAGKTSH
jgi:hypothetical protein